MYDIWYNFFIDTNFLGGAVQYASIETLCRYLAVGMTIGTFAFAIICLYTIFRKVCKWFL